MARLKDEADSGHGLTWTVKWNQKAETEALEQRRKKKIVLIRAPTKRRQGVFAF